MNSIKNYITTIIMVIITAVFTAAAVLYDPQPIAANGTDVGFGGFNLSVNQSLGADMRWYSITEIIGYVAILVVLSFGLAGLMQLIKRRSLLKVDRGIITLGVTYVVMAVVYAAFEFVVINYRPMIMPGEMEAEASFPSSHTMLVVVVFGTAAIEWARQFKGQKALAAILVILSIAMICIMCAGRLLSGCHWATDIIGGVLYGLTIVTFYYNISRKRA